MAAEALGLSVDELPEGWQPVEALVIAKCLLPEGHESGYPYGVVALPSPGLAPWDVAGMARAAVVQADDQMRSGGSYD